jgi:flap endonuclease-1
MGIKNLNRYLLDNCSNQTIQKKQLSIFSGKTIVVDTSIYLYKFLEENELIENMYLMISIFLNYNITPIFIFDGKPPKEKQDMLKKRKQDKQTAENKYNSLKLQIESEDISNDTKEEMQIELNKLKKQFVRIQPKDIEAVKELMMAYGIQYIDAEGEADRLCAKMVLQKDAWACLSDDMDMFVYGCTRIMRHMSLTNHTIIYYNLNGILRELQLPLHEFREIIILSGTDYNLHQKISLYKALKLHKEYKQTNPNIDFYQWLSEKHIPNSKQLYDIYSMFDIAGDQNSQYFIKPTNKMNRPRLRQFLETYGFIFL